MACVPWLIGFSLHDRLGGWLLVEAYWRHGVVAQHMRVGTTNFTLPAHVSPYFDDSTAGCSYTAIRRSHVLPSPDTCSFINHG